MQAESSSRGLLIGDPRANAWWLRIIGVVEILFGIVAITAPLVAGGAVITLIGSMLVVLGAGQSVQASRAGTARRRLPFVGGVLAIVCGLLVLAHPLLGLGFLVVLLAAFLAAEGLWKIFLAWQLRALAGAGWMLASGVVALFLGWMIWSQWPLSGSLAIGTLVGVDFILGGWSLIMLAHGARAR